MKAILITTDNQRRLAFQWNVDEEDLDDRLPIGYWLLAEFGSDTFFTLTQARFDAMYPLGGTPIENDYVSVA